ncbi:MAG: D-alanine--D-alanine ligase [Gammaproteobacteria bacterium]|nr:D-alanine--D-alanine ligase [Gammaproteobacteria bacterium]
MQWSSERVALLYGGQGAERHVSYDSKAAVAEAMRQLGIQPIEIDVATGLLQALDAAEPTRAFVCVHGRPGEDGVLQGILSYLGIPYTGSGVAASALAMDKPRAKQVWQSLDLPTAPMVVVTAIEQADICSARLGQHLFVKPAHEGSSVGAFQVHSEPELVAALKIALAMDSHVLVEPMLTGPEYTIGILKDLALPVIRIEPATGFYDYTAKYVSDATHYRIPCGLHSAMEARAQEMAIEAFDALGCRTWGRVDLMAGSDGQLYLLEVNTVPGMTSHSLVPKAARAAGMDMAMLVEQILLDAEATP